VYIAINNIAVATSVEMILSDNTPEKAFDNLVLSPLFMATSRIPTVPIPIMAKRMK
jgi:hypothetical protein